MLVGGSITQRFSSSFLLRELIFILGQTSRVIAVEGPHQVVFPKLPGRMSWLKAWALDAKAAPLGHSTAVDSRLWKKGMNCLLVAVLISGPSIQPSTSLIIPPLGHIQPKAFSTVLSKEEQVSFPEYFIPVPSPRMAVMSASK